MDEHEIGDPNNTFRALMNELVEELGHIGIHVEYTSIVGAPNPDEDGNVESPEDFDTETIVGQIKNQQGHFGIAVRAILKDLAWDERVLDPEGYALATQENILMPTTEDMIHADIKAWVEEHGSIDGWRMPDIFKDDLELEGDTDEA